MNGNVTIRQAISSALPCLLAALLAVTETTAKSLSDEAFAQSPYFFGPSMSDDGKFFVARVEDDPMRVFSVFRWENDGVTPLLGMRDTEEVFVRYANWATNDTLILSIGRLWGPKARIRVDGERQRYATRYADALYVYAVPDGNEKDKNNIWKLSDGASIVSTLPSDPDHILIQRDGDVYKANIRIPDQLERIQRYKKDINVWRADRSGNVRIGIGSDRNGNRILIMREQGETEFRDFSHLVEERDDNFTGFVFAENENQIYVFSRHETDTVALYLFDIPTGEFITQIYHNPDFDLDHIRFDPKDGQLQAVVYEAERSHTIWFDEIAKREIAKIRRVFPTQFIEVQYYEKYSEYMVVDVSAPDDPGRYYIYNRRLGELIALPEQQSALDESRLGKQVSTLYAARDGLRIPAYVTLPSGMETLDQVTNEPFIIMPHGGPAARDFSGFDAWAQFFATQGFGVLQMNFRGSSGYGLSYEVAGRQEWGKLMQDDITDGVGWLVDQGHADPDRIAIVGASYGGYAALMGAIKTPELFQCAISFAGVSNLPDLLAGTDSDSFITRMIGDRFSQLDDLRENSPVHRFRDIDIPIMLIHGRLDPIVPYSQSEDLSKIMNRADKENEFVALPQSGHGLNDYDDRLRFYSEQRRYIQNCLKQ